jgi:hypothetical protein
MKGAAMADHPQDNEFLDHALMEETRLYVERGRNLKDRSDEDVLNVCVATIERWFPDRSEPNQQAMNDAMAELRLRGLDLPEDRLKPLLDKMREEMRSQPGGPNGKVRQQIRDFVEARNKPPN